MSEQFSTVSTPCCQAEVSLRWDDFVHRGYPRQDDVHSIFWNLRCPSCERMLKVGIEVRLRRAYDCGTWDTRRRLVGGWIWLDEKDEVAR